MTALTVLLTPSPKGRPCGTADFAELLTPDGYNPKTQKGRARGYATAILHFAPAKLSGYNVCQFASAGCTAACLHTAGRGGILKIGAITNAVRLARIARTRLYFRDRFTFCRLLTRNIEQHVRRAIRHGLTPVVRLNGTSDLPWETLLLSTNGLTILETFPTIQFYDYTKNVKRALANAAGKHPSNYHLTFSRSETNSEECDRVLAAGGNIAAVFAVGTKSKANPDPSLPVTFAGRPVFNGDADDLRFMDPAGVVVGLKAKGRAGKKDLSGFVIPLAA